MVRLICIVMMLVCINCQAQENYISAGIQWLKSSLPETTKVELIKSRIKFDGCKHREYELAFTQPINQSFSLEGGFSYAKGSLNWGVNNQQISVRRYSFLPRFKINNRMSVSAGVIYQSAPEFKTSQGVELQLPTSHIYKISSRLQGLRDHHQVEFELSSHAWDATAEFGSLFENGLTDNKINVSYSAFF